MKRFGFIVTVCFLLQSIPLAESGDQFCLPGKSNNIFAADNLQNGTIRLYGRSHYWDLELYQSEPKNDQSKTFLSRMMWSLGAGQKLPKKQLFLESSHLHLYARIEDSVPQDRLISAAYQGLNFSVADTRSVHRAIVSLADSHNLEYTFMFESMANTSPSSAHSHISSRFWLWDTATGQFKSRSEVVDDSSHDHAGGTHSKNNLISSTFRVFLNDTLHIFFTVNNTFYWAKHMKLDSFPKDGDVNLNEISLEEDQSRFHRGTVPQPISAAFVVQASSELIWVVLIQCTHYCAVPWVLPEGYFDFTQCHSSKQWKLMDPFFGASTDLFHGLSRFENYLPVHHKTKEATATHAASVDNTDDTLIKSTTTSSPNSSDDINSSHLLNIKTPPTERNSSSSSDWHTISLAHINKENSAFAVDHDNHYSVHGWTWVVLLLSIIVIFITVFCGVFGVHVYKKGRGNSYNIFKAELKQQKRRSKGLLNVSFTDLASQQPPVAQVSIVMDDDMDKEQNLTEHLELPNNEKEVQEMDDSMDTPLQANNVLPQVVEVHLQDEVHLVTIEEEGTTEEVTVENSAVLESAL